MFKLTGAAARQIHQAASASGALGLALRIAARVDADGSRQYGMGFNEAREQDMKLELNGVTVVIAGEFQELLVDTLLDFVEPSPGDFSFIFIGTRQFPIPLMSAPTGSCTSSGCTRAGHRR